MTSSSQQLRYGMPLERYGELKILYSIWTRMPTLWLCEKNTELLNING
jgi:hypothetical protein